MINNSDNAATIGVPRGFALDETLGSAKTIYLLTAYARQSGWRLLKRPLVNSRARLVLVAGQNFWLTEPRVLKDWMKQASTGRAECYLHAKKPVFHPKVMVVDSGSSSFAIVGSSNLSNGGIATNIECNLYIGMKGPQSETFQELFAWVTQLIGRTACQELTPDVYASYYNEWKVNAKQIPSLSREEHQGTTKFAGTVAYHIHEYEECVADLRKVLRSSTYRRERDQHRDANLRYLKRLKSSLRLAARWRIKDVRKDDWRIVYEGHVPLGDVVTVQAQQAASNLGALRKALRTISDSSMSAPERFGRVVRPGPDYVKGIGHNIASKLLMALDSSSCPILNNAVIDTMGEYYGAEFTGRSRRNDAVPPAGHRYAAFRKTMLRLKADVGVPDMVELDRVIWMNS